MYKGKKFKAMKLTLCHKRQLQLNRRFCVTDRSGVQSIGHKLCPWPRDFDQRPKQPYAAQVCRLMVSTPVIHVITWIATHSSTQKGWKAELAWLVDPQRTLYPRSGHMSTIDQAKIGESPTAKDQRRDHRATPPMCVFS